MRNKYFRFIFFLVFFSLSLFALYSALSSKNGEDNILSILLLFFICIYSLVTIYFRDKKSYSLYGVIWVFIFIFFGIAPLFQICSGIFPWSYEINNDLLLYGCFILIIGLIIFDFSYCLKIKSNMKIQELRVITKRGISDVILILLSLVSFLILAKFIGLKNLFYRNLYNSNLDFSTSGKSFTLILTYFVRFLPVCSFVVIFKKSKKFFDIYTIISFILMIIAVFPLGLGRFEMATIYMGIALLLLKKFFQSRGKMIETILIFSLLFIFPGLTQLRYHSISEIGGIARLFNIENFTTSFSSGDFDAFSVFLRAIEVIDSHGASMLSVLGVFLFFIPRSVWPSKPIPSGELIANLSGLSFGNISCPIFAEGYVNAGLFGLIIFAIIFGLISKYLDSKYKVSSEYSLINLVYPFLLGFFFITCRGALMSCYAYTIGFVVSSVFVLLVNNIFASGGTLNVYTFAKK